MDRKRQLDAHVEYIESNGLHSLIDFQENLDYEERAFDAVSENAAISYPPEASDLVRLHRLIRKRKPFTVLEFGLGYSTVVIADALEKNQKEWEALEDVPEIRNRFMFQLFSVDTSEKWIETARGRFPAHLASRVHFHHSEAKIGTFNGQLCHYYTNLPDIVPDFVYLDGPFPKDVQGTINGLSFRCDERTVMSGDLLLMEPTLLPGTFILVDGRVNNARFLQRNFSREYEVSYHHEEDVTTFELKEERLGKYNLLGSDFFQNGRLSTHSNGHSNGLHNDAVR